MAFHEIRFPDNISRGARGGPERRTQVVELASGDEERNASWANSRRRYDVAYGIRRADESAARGGRVLARGDATLRRKSSEARIGSCTAPTVRQIGLPVRTSRSVNPSGRGKAAANTSGLQATRHASRGRKCWLRRLPVFTSHDERLVTTLPSSVG